MGVIVNTKLPELGRIRIGIKGDRGQPQRLATFRLTSNDKNALMEAARIFGGSVVPWNGDDHQHKLQLITKVAEIPIIIAPVPHSQWYEKWARGSKQSKCDGITCTTYRPGQKSGEVVEVQQACTCPPPESTDKRECSLKTRAWFVLPDIPGLGVWRYETGGIFAAMELPGILNFLAAQKLSNMYPEASLVLDQRKIMKAGVAKVFPVVTIRLKESMRQLQANARQAGILGPSTNAQIDAPTVKMIEGNNDADAPAEIILEVPA